MASLGSVIATIGGAAVTQVSTTLTDIKGTDTNHTVTTVTVPAGQTWLVAMVFNRTASGSGTTENYYPQFSVGGVLGSYFLPNDTRPGHAVVLTAGTYVVHVRTNTNLNSYAMSGTAVVYTVKL